VGQGRAEAHIRFRRRLRLFLHYDIWLCRFAPLQIFSVILVLWGVLLFSPGLNLIISSFNEPVSEVAHDLLSAFVHDLPPNLLERIPFDLQS